MKTILPFASCFALSFFCTCFKVDKIYETNKTNLFLHLQKNVAHKKYKPRSSTLLHSDKSRNTSSPPLSYEQNVENEVKMRKKIEEERERREQIKKENILFINKNFKYVSNNIPINVEKKYTYETFKYSDEILSYVFFVINLFKHEQYKNKVYKEHLQKESSQGRSNWDTHTNELFPPYSNVTNKLSERNQTLVSYFIQKFGDKFKFFNTPERIQREDWANMFKLEQEDKNNFFKNIKIKNEKTNEYYFVIYYCNWQYECMALYNALHRIFHNSYNNVHFYNIDNSVHGKDMQGEGVAENLDPVIEKSMDEGEIITKEDIEKIKEMYIKDMQSGEITDIDSLLSKEENEKNDAETDSTQENSDKNQPPSGDKASSLTKEGSKEAQTQPEENKKKSFQEIMAEEKKKLDEEFFLYGYSKYENIEQIKKEEEMIKETKQIIKEEKSNQDKLNNERDFKNILNDFAFHITNYKNMYQYDADGEEEKKDLSENPSTNLSEDERSAPPQTLFRTNSADNQPVEERNAQREVNINVIFVRLSNSTVIAKTKNIKEKIKKKWIYSHEKEIKFYELILSVMLNENIYYKDIPHMDIFSITYNKKKLYDFFNQVNSNLKHSFIHKNNVYDIYNNVINENMDVYNFDIYDGDTNSPKGTTSEDGVHGEASNPSGDFVDSTPNDHVVFEELSLDEEEKEDFGNYQVIYDGRMHDRNDIDEQPQSKTTNAADSKETDTPDSSPLKKKGQMQYKVIKKKHNKKEKSKYETLFKRKYSNIFSNTIKSKLSIEKISSISNVQTHANCTIDTFKNYSLREIFQNVSPNENFKIDENYVYYSNYKIPKEIFPFILQMSLAFKYEHTTLLMNAPKKVQFEFRNV
ncbi:hypothetical protein C922_04836 [Plasmodium inui San Antonio 1]|uniref:Uncharacterized protein n=1 Tax=Plasmodium inui San Antonio 1 TaxID=1237626 RepID=W6ZZT1_9APIC|nr:hypothetical protein C922_04836 [Plasmodium inui San Antonio 1]EUD64800.1 hypothetical protein C922_04836 [Plasmodium inui San Antonio 1]